jgi:hypothetical protein
MKKAAQAITDAAGLIGTAIVFLRQNECKEAERRLVLALNLLGKAIENLVKE